jgi:hypothetical protein
VQCSQCSDHVCLYLLLPSFAWWWRCGDCFVHLPYIHTGSGKRFFSWALINISCIDYVVGRDVGCCKICTTWRQAETFVSRFVCLINSNKAQFAFDSHFRWTSNTNYKSRDDGYYVSDLSSGDVLWESSPGNLSFEEFAFYIYQSWDISWRWHQRIHAYEPPNNIRPNYCKLWDRWNDLQLAVTCSRQYLE